MRRPFMLLALSLADKNWRLRAQLAQRDRQVDGLTARLRRIQADVELMSAAIPREKRALALSLVRDRHRIEEGDVIEEVGGT